ncbi:uncharacterized protein LOC143247102 isoform X2 [Tachypleus tridentatus]|uniref:uncharacterized protein LOC143247102 isoform X2 n=1 Tax=Tachypleus tridentatus TaxID=6853 RepID=UPI003FCFB986
MLGVFRKHLKPKRSCDGRKNKDKDKTTLHTNIEFSNDSRELTRPSQIVQDARHVLPKDKEKDCRICMIGHKNHYCSSESKETKDSHILELKDQQLLFGKKRKDSLTETNDVCAQNSESILLHKDKHQWKFQNSIPFGEISSKELNDQGCRELSPRCEENVSDQNLSGGSSVDLKQHINELDFTGYVNRRQIDDRYWFEKCDEVCERVPFADDLPSSQEPAGEVDLEMVREKKDSLKKEQLKKEIQKDKIHQVDIETWLREVWKESQNCKMHLANLQNDFEKMEEMVMNMLQLKSHVDQLRHEKSSLALAYESKIRNYQTCLTSMEKENVLLLNELCHLKASYKDQDHERKHSFYRIVLEKVRLLEQQNAELLIENEQQQFQFENCFDDIVNQVLQALLAQKGLREEYRKLQQQIVDLEQQNKVLYAIFKKQVLSSADLFSQPGPHHQGLSQQPSCNSPTHTNQSEDSTDSLASLCSDYSFGSRSSGGNVIRHPGLPKMSSPPQWLRDHPSLPRYSSRKPIPNSDISAKKMLTNTSYEFYKSSMMKRWADLVPRPPDQECYSKDEIFNYAIQAEKLENNKHKPQDGQSLLESKSLKGIRTANCKGAVEQEEYNKKCQKQPFDVQGLENSSEHRENVPCESVSQKLLTPVEYNTQNICHVNQYRHSTTTQNTATCCMPLVNRNSSYISQQDQNTYFAFPKVSSQTDICSSETNIPFSTTIDIVPQHHFQASHSRDILNMVPTGHHEASSSVNYPTLNMVSSGHHETSDSVSFPSLNKVPPSHQEVSHSVSFPKASTPCPMPLNMVSSGHNETSHSVSFSELKHKLHNTYEKEDLPSFTTNKSIVFESPKHSASPGENSLLENWYTDKYSSKLNSLDVEYTNTVIRRGYGTTEANKWCTKHDNLQSAATSTAKAQVHSHLTNDSPSQRLQAMKECSKAGEILKHLSSYVLEGIHHPTSTMKLSEVQECNGKDDGYSTMSSYEQTEVNISNIDPEVNDTFKLKSELIQPVHLNSGFEVDPVMVSSSDSGLGLPQGLQDQRLSFHNSDDGCVCLDKKVDSVLIPDRHLLSLLDTKPSVNIHPTLSNNDQEGKVHLDNSVMDTSSTGQCSFSTGKKDSLSTYQSSIYPSYDKILTLLTPQGYKAGRNDMQKVTLPALQLPTVCKTETSEKSTSVESKYLGTDSNLSLSSVRDKALKELVEKSRKTQVHKETQVELHMISSDNSLFRTKYSNGKQIEAAHVSSLEVEPATKKRIRANTYQGVILLHSICKFCQRCISCKSCQSSINSTNLPFRDTFAIRRVISDSCLYVKKQRKYIVNDFIKLSFNDDQQLNLQLLIQHSSAQDLAHTAVVASSRYIPGLQQSQCRVLVNERQDHMKCNSSSNKTIEQRWPVVEPENSMSLISDQSSISECSSSELGATNLKCLRDVYGEEEIGNWTFQLSFEDVNQLTTSFCDRLDPTTFVHHPCSHHIGKIQEERVTVENYQEELWNQALWTGGVVQQTVINSLTEPKQDNSSEISQNWKSKESSNDISSSICKNDFAKNHYDHNIKTDTCVKSESLLNKQKDEEHSLELFPNTAVSALSVVYYCDSLQNQENIVTSTSRETENNIFQNDKNSSVKGNMHQTLQVDTTEFNQDFYRLCPLDFPKHLNDSPKSMKKLELGKTEFEDKSSSKLSLQEQSRRDSNSGSSRESVSVNSYLVKRYPSDLPLKRQPMEDSKNYLINLLESESIHYHCQISKSLPNISLPQEKANKKLDYSSENVLEVESLNYPKQEDKTLTNVSLSEEQLLKKLGNSQKNVLEDKSLNYPEVMHNSLTNLFLFQEQFAKNLHDSSLCLLQSKSKTLEEKDGFLTEVLENELIKDSNDFPEVESEEKDESLQPLLLLEEQSTKDLVGNLDGELICESILSSQPKEESLKATALLQEQSTKDLIDILKSLPGSKSVISSEPKEKSLLSTTLLQEQSIKDPVDILNILPAYKSFTSSGPKEESVPDTALIQEQFTKDLIGISNSLPGSESGISSEPNEESFPDTAVLQEQFIEDPVDILNSLSGSESVISSEPKDKLLPATALLHDQSTKGLSKFLDTFSEVEHIESSGQKEFSIANYLSSQEQISHPMESLSRSEPVITSEQEVHSSTDSSILQKCRLKSLNELCEELPKSEAINVSRQDDNIIRIVRLFHGHCIKTPDDSSKKLHQLEPIHPSQQVLKSFNKSTKWLLKPESPLCLGKQRKSTTSSVLQKQSYLERSVGQHQNTEGEALCTVSVVQQAGKRKTSRNKSDKTNIKKSGLVAVLSHNKESKTFYHKELILHQDKRKSDKEHSFTKNSSLKTQEMRKSHYFSKEEKKWQKCTYSNGNITKDVSNKLYKVPNRKSRSKGVHKSSDLQNSLGKEKLRRYDKTKMSVIANSSAYKELTGRSSKPDVNKRQWVKGKECTLKKTQSSHRVLRQIRQPLQGFGNHVRTGSSPDSRRSGWKSHWELSQDKRTSKRNKTRDMKQQYSKQGMKNANFQDKEKRKGNLHKDPLLPKSLLSPNIDVAINKSDISIGDRIQHLNSLHEQNEKEWTFIIPHLKQRTKPVREHSNSDKTFNTNRRESICDDECESKEEHGTSWIHVETNIDLSDPEERANLLDSMMATMSNSSEEEDGNEVQEYQHNQRLHALHRFRRQKKRASDRDAVIGFLPKIRTSVINYHDFFYRFGEKEREAVACFDFLNDFSTSPSDVGSCEVLNEDKRLLTPVVDNNNTITVQEVEKTSNILHTFDLSMSSFAPVDHLNLESTWYGNRRLTKNCLSSLTLLSQDGEPVDHISFSDSCAESYSSSTHSLNQIN